MKRGKKLLLAGPTLRGKRLFYEETLNEPMSQRRRQRFRFGYLIAEPERNNTQIKTKQLQTKKREEKTHRFFFFYWVAHVLQCDDNESPPFSPVRLKEKKKKIVDEDVTILLFTGHGDLETGERLISVGRHKGERDHTLSHTVQPQLPDRESSRVVVVIVFLL